ncbi:hypothetical protein E8E15_006993, partial [Penicillium rubens]
DSPKLLAGGSPGTTGAVPEDIGYEGRQAGICQKLCVMSTLVGHPIFLRASAAHGRYLRDVASKSWVSRHMSI